MDLALYHFRMSHPPPSSLLGTKGLTLVARCSRNSMGFSTMIDTIKNGMNKIIKQLYNFILNSTQDISPNLENHPPLGLQDHCVYLNRTMHALNEILEGV